MLVQWQDVPWITYVSLTLMNFHSETNRYVQTSEKKKSENPRTRFFQKSAHSGRGLQKKNHP